MAGPTERNITLFPQLKHCVETGQLNVLQQLAEQEGLVHLQYVDFSNRILHFACQDFNRQLSPAIIQAKQSMIKWLVEHGAADPADVQLQSGLHTPLHKAVAGGNQSVVTYLLNSGFQANQRDVHGRTPLFIAAINVAENPNRHSKGMLQTLLLNLHINPLIQDNQYGTILHYAVKMKSTVLAKEILKENFRLSQPAVAQDGVILREEAKSWMRNLVLAFDSSNRIAKYYAEHPTRNKHMEKILMDGLMLGFIYDKSIPDPVPQNPLQELVAPALLPGDMAVGDGDQVLPDPIPQNHLQNLDAPALFPGEMAIGDGDQGVPAPVHQNQLQDLVAQALLHDDMAIGDEELVIPDPVSPNQMQKLLDPALLPASGGMAIGNGVNAEQSSDDQTFSDSVYQSTYQQLQLLQLMLWKNGHHLTGVKAKNPSTNDSALSRLTAAVFLNGSLPDPPSDGKPLKSLFKEFSAKGGPAALSNYLLTHEGEKEKAEEMDGIASSSEMPPTKRRCPTPDPAVSFDMLPSQHSLAVLNILLGIPSFAQIALVDQRTALLLVRLALSVSGDDHGSILNEADATLLATLPFELFQRVLNAHPRDSPEGAQLRQQLVDTGAFQLLLACLAVSTEQVAGAAVAMNPLGLKFVIGYLTADGIGGEPATKKQKGSAIGTEYGLGASAQSVDANEVEQCHPELEGLLRAIAAFISESTPRASVINAILLPAGVKEIIQSSYLIPALCTYLRKDSVMYVTGHVRLLRAVFHLMRCMAAYPEVSSLLVTPPSDGSSSSGTQSIFSLLCKLRKDTQRDVSTPVCGDQAEDPKEEIADDLIFTWTAIQTVVIANLPPAVPSAASGVSSEGEELERGILMERRDYD